MVFILFTSILLGKNFGISKASQLLEQDYTFLALITLQSYILWFNLTKLISMNGVHDTFEDIYELHYRMIKNIYVAARDESVPLSSYDLEEKEAIEAYNEKVHRCFNGRSISQCVHSQTFYDAHTTIRKHFETRKSRK